jgi:hypothetical protein
MDKTIKYYMHLGQSQTTGFYHVVFEDLLAAGKFFPKFMEKLSLAGKYTDQILFNDGGGGTQRTIVITGEEGAEIWNEVIAPYVWPDYSDGTGKNFFLVDYASNLIAPKVCANCKKKDAPITETIVKDGKAVSSHSYCFAHDRYYNFLLESAFYG